jgi:hypothetical protein
MKKKIVTVVSEFTDFKGLVHKFVVAAVSMPVDADITIYDEDENYGGHTYAEKAVKLGVAVCNPVDKYDEEKGKAIAINKAISCDDYALYATLPGMINTAVVDALVKQEVEFIKNNPARVIPGYIEEKEKFEKRKAFTDALNALTEEERSVYNAMKEHKFPKVEALLNA